MAMAPTTALNFLILVLPLLTELIATAVGAALAAAVTGPGTKATSSTCSLHRELCERNQARLG